jgi:hypothetical protein
MPKSNAELDAPTHVAGVEQVKVERAVMRTTCDGGPARVPSFASFATRLGRRVDGRQMPWRVPPLSHLHAPKPARKSREKLGRGRA